MRSDPLAARLLLIFAEELDGQLAEMHASIAALKREPADPVAIRALLRVTHTLKGASRAAGLPLIEQLCHSLESGLARARDAATPLDDEMLSALLEAADALAAARERIAAGENADPQSLTSALDHARGRSPREATPDPAPREMASVRPAAAPVAAATPSEPAVSPGASGETTRREESVRIAVHHVDAIAAAGAEIALLSTTLVDNATQLSTLRSTLRDQSQDERGESSRMVDRELRRLARAAAEASRALHAITSRLDGALRHLRQRPVSELTDALERVARDVARDLGREVNASTSGGAIEADRVVLEALREPLLHLIRNAVDHGLESPDARVRAGKSSAGTVRIEATLRGDRLLLRVADDGRGLDLNAIRSSLARAGRPVPVSDDGVRDSIFDEGISTSATLTTLSGRGVGLSIVRTSAARLGGTVAVESTPGRGTAFVLDIPVSIATLRAMIARVGEYIVAIPSSFVVRSSRIETASLRHIENHDLLITDFAPIPIVPLAQLLGRPYTSEPWGDRILALTLDVAGNRVAVTVDDLLDERELVLRPLEHVSRSAASISVGSALLNTGQAILVLSAPVLVGELASSRRAGGTSHSAARRTVKAASNVLVVDDSITSRSLEESVLAAAGYKVTTAINGLEAWNILNREASFDVVVSDVEMPELDGIGLCERIRANPRTANLPVILVTSLDRPEHRARGLDAGADAYIAKSGFDQDALLRTIHELIGGGHEGAT